MTKYVIVKYENKPNAKSCDDIKEDKYLRYFELDHNPYPRKAWTQYVYGAIHFFNEEFAKYVIAMLRLNSPYPMKIEEIK